MQKLVKEDEYYLVQSNFRKIIFFVLCAIGAILIAKDAFYDRGYSAGRDAGYREAVQECLIDRQEGGIPLQCTQGNI